MGALWTLFQTGGCTINVQERKRYIKTESVADLASFSFYLASEGVGQLTSHRHDQLYIPATSERVRNLEVDLIQANELTLWTRKERRNVCTAQHERRPAGVEV